MLKPKLKLLAGAVLLMSLAACATKPAPLVLLPERPKAEKQIARVCPRPISDKDKLTIADEIDAAIAKGAPPNKTATELERLNDAAKVCRGA